MRGESEGAAWYRQAVDRSPDPIFITDVDGRLLDWNHASERLLADDLAGRRTAEFFRMADGSAIGPLLARVVSGETIGSVELHCAGREGERRMLLMCVFPSLASDSRTVEGCVFFGTDVTDRIRFETELMAAKDAAEAAVQLKSTILNNLSHEIRTPLTAILGFAELLFEEVPEPHREFIHLIRASGKRLMGTLVAVLELARLESGDVRFDLQPLDVVEEAREALQMFGPTAERKGLRLELVHPEHVPPVWLDRVALNRILSNLLSNAIKFTPDGSVRLEVGVAADHVELRVADTGIGMSDEFLPFLFEEFKQESEGMGRRHEGAGLGLAITKRLVEQMGGEISAESKKGNGSVFVVRLPRPLRSASGNAVG